MKTGVNVSDAMTRRPVFIGAEANIIECAKKMQEYNVGSIVIKDKSNFLGFVTDYDFIKLVANKKTDLKKLKVKDIMTPKEGVVSVGPNTDLYEALKIMQDYEVKRLPVVHEGKILGLLTVKDVLKIQPQLFDLLVEKYELRDENEKIFFSNRGELKQCDICGEKEKVYNVRGKNLCRSCRDIL